MRADKTRIILDCVPNYISSAMGGLDKAREELDELERLARIGKATGKAYFNGAFLIYDVVENDDGTIERHNCDETIEELLGWLGFTESED